MMKNAILLHLHYQDLWPEIWSYLKDIVDENTHLYVTVHTTETEWYNDVKTNSTEVFLMEDKGMDFGGFLYAYNKIKQIPYTIIIKVHGKKRNRFKDVTSLEWTKKLLSSLVERENYEELKKTFENKKSFFAGSKMFFRQEHANGHFSLGKQKESYEKINKILNLPSLDMYEFIAGSMFAVSKAYLDLFLNNKEMDLFDAMERPPYPGHGTLAHGLERLISSHVATFGGTLLLRI